MKNIRIRKKGSLVLAGIALLIIVSLAFAGNGPEQPRSLIASGGSEAGSGGIKLSSALGQPVTGAGETGNLLGADGFWVGSGIQPIPTPIPGSDHFIYLPVATR